MGKQRTGQFIAVCLIGWIAVLATDAHAVEATGKGYPGRADLAAAPVSPSVSAASPAQGAQPAASGLSSSSASADFESQPLSFANSGNRRQLRGGDGERERAAPSIWTVMFFVFLVCGGFCAVLVLAKKYLPGHRQLFSHPAMEVLGRTHLDQKRYVSLLRVGKRIVVIGVSPDEMRSLSEITDEEEITGIMEVARPKTEAGLSIFQRLFQRNVVDHESAENRAIAKEKVAELEEQTAFLRNRVRAIRETEDPVRRVDTLG